MDYENALKALSNGYHHVFPPIHPQKYEHYSLVLLLFNYHIAPCLRVFKATIYYHFPGNSEVQFSMISIYHKVPMDMRDDGVIASPIIANGIYSMKLLL